MGLIPMQSSLVISWKQKHVIPISCDIPQLDPQRTLEINWSTFYGLTLA